MDMEAAVVLVHQAEIKKLPRGGGAIRPPHLSTTTITALFHGLEILADHDQLI